MGAWKQFLASDIIVNPFVVNKGFTFSSSQFATGSDGQLVGIDRFLGTNVNWFEDQSTTGTLNTEYQSLIYNSAKQLYYTNFLSSSTGDNVAQPILVPGFNSSGNVLIGRVESPLYDNFLQSTLVPTRFWPTASGAEIGVVSIPSKIYGEYIVPTSFIFDYSSSFKAYDDGEGNLYSSASFTWVSSSLQEFFYSESVELLYIHIFTIIFIFHISIRTRLLIIEKAISNIMQISLLTVLTIFFLNIILINLMGAKGAAYASLISWGLSTILFPLFSSRTRHYPLLFVNSFIINFKK
jgi:hypothetical protein